MKKKQHTVATSRKQQTVNRYGGLAKDRTMLNSIVLASGDTNFKRTPVDPKDEKR